MKHKVFSTIVGSLTFVAATLFVCNGTNAQVINTIAGTGTGTFSGDGGAATAAALRNPSSLKVDASGNIYIADYLNQRIRKIDPSGTMTTVAGSSSAAAFGGDGGPATAAWLAQPAAIALDGSGNMYISDNLNHRIRKVDASGIISTVAGNSTSGYSGDGGPATAAILANPSGINTDAAGNVYFADDGNNTVRKITVSTGIITTVAGNGAAGYSGDGGAATAAKLNQPKDAAVDQMGNVYIAGWLNNSIRKVSTSGIITTIAGISSAGSYGNGVPATSALLNNPYSVWVDADTNIIICDNGNARIRRINTAGIISTIAGNGSFGFSGDGGNALSAQMRPAGTTTDAAGNIYIAESGNHRIRKITITPASITGTSTSLCEGANMTLTGNPTGGTWTDGGSTVASVTSTGLVTGLVAGTAIITYTTLYSQDTTVITVNQQPAAITGATTVCIAATTPLATTTTGGAWTSSVPAVATVDASGIVTGVAPGTSTITYAMPTGCSTISGISVISCPTEVGNVSELNNDINIYPNPSDGAFSITMPHAEKSVEVTINDAVGKVIYKTAQSNTQTITCNLPDTANGILFVKVVAGEKIYTEKILMAK